ncbi:LOW QUALITY PROTEIN: hypothetical protein PanWU01x14_150990 [Parasponia andersonii]|uniref:Uncharacterized protein n=1 Tax=Parasponia andersonii TaxID=3476 RepID=A0A2P5CI13_PARAD|nr:LOW QUALITY PROTEIN: hypothetical protein PanWU01x14_150990 [Parasponia andersonii]
MVFGQNFSKKKFGQNFGLDSFGYKC